MPSINPMQLLQLVGQLKAINNPLGLMQQMFGNNPMLGTAMKMSEGKSPEQMKAIVQNLCKEKGIDFANIANIASQFGIKI